MSVFSPPGRYDALNYRIMQWNIHSLATPIDSMAAESELDVLQSLLHSFFSDDANRRDDLSAVQRWSNRKERSAAVEAAVQKATALIRSGHFWHLRFGVADLLLVTPEDFMSVFVHDKIETVAELFEWCHHASTPMFLAVFIPIVAGESWDSLKGSTAWTTRADQWPYDLKCIAKDRIYFWETILDKSPALSGWLSEWVPLAVIAKPATVEGLDATLNEWMQSRDTLPPTDAKAEYASAVRWAVLQSLLTGLTHMYDKFAGYEG